MNATTESIRERIEEAASRTRNAPQLKTIARFVNEQNGYTATITPFSANARFDRSGRRISIRTTTRERIANRLMVYRTNSNGTFPVYNYDSDDPYYTNNDVCRWVVRNIIEA